MLWAHTTSRKCLPETSSTSGEAGKFHLRCSHIETKYSGPVDQSCLFWRVEVLECRCGRGLRRAVKMRF